MMIPAKGESHIGKDMREQYTLQLEASNNKMVQIYIMTHE